MGKYEPLREHLDASLQPVLRLSFADGQTVEFVVGSVDR